MRASNLFAGGAANFLAQHGQVARLVGLNGKAERRRVDAGVDHAAIGDVDRHRLLAGDFERVVEVEHEARHVGDLHRAHPAAPAVGAHRDAAGRGVQMHQRLGLAHRHHAGFQQHGRRAHRIRAGHRRIFRLFHDDQPSIAIGADRRRQQIDVAGDRAARLADQQLADVVVVALHRLHPLEHAGAVGRQDATGDDIADLALGVGSDHCDGAAGLHRETSLWCRPEFAGAARQPVGDEADPFLQGVIGGAQTIGGDAVGLPELARR